MDESSRIQTPKRKRRSRLRLLVLSIALALTAAVYLPLRTSRANESLVQSLAVSDAAGVRAALDHGADPDVRVQPAAAADHLGSLMGFLRLFFHRGLHPTSNSAKTALMYAANGGDSESLTALLKHGANVDARLDNGYSALLFAAAKQPSDIVEALLARGADVHVHNRAGGTPLLSAAQAGWTQNVRLLLARGEDVHEVNSRVQTALSLAEVNHHEETIQVLLAQGADERDLKPTPPLPTGRPLPLASSGAGSHSFYTVNGVTTIVPEMRATQELSVIPPLVFAAKCGSPALMKFLWERTGSDIKQRYGWNIFCYAVQSNRPEAVKFLLDRNPHLPQPFLPTVQKGMPPHYLNGYDPSKVYTPLHYAAGLPTPEIARLLIAHGADVNAEDMAGTTPLLAAAMGSHRATLSLLIEHGANVRATERNSGQNALMRGGRDVEVAHLLLDHGLDVNARDRNGRTALMQCYSPQVAALLIERGADVNVRDTQGDTALFAAIRSYQADTAALLLKHGADVNGASRRGETPLSVARNMRAWSLVAQLARAGATR